MLRRFKFEKMKSFILILTIAFVANFADVESRMTMEQILKATKVVQKMCIPKSGVTNELLDGTHNGEFPPDRTLQCYFKCVLGTMKTMKDGKIDVNSIEKQASTMLPEEMFDRIMAVARKCAAEATSDDDCEASWQFSKCYYETDKEVYFFP